MMMMMNDLHCYPEFEVLRLLYTDLRLSYAPTTPAPRDRHYPMLGDDIKKRFSIQQATTASSSSTTRQKNLKLDPLHTTAERQSRRCQMMMLGSHLCACLMTVTLSNGARHRGHSFDGSLAWHSWHKSKCPQACSTTIFGLSKHTMQFHWSSIISCLTLLILVIALCSFISNASSSSSLSGLSTETQP